VADALFQRDGNRFVPSDFARGPWSPDALHGGPVAALVARAVEECASPEPMHVARTTVELLRPVPVAALSVEAAVVRPGRKVQLVEVKVSAGDTELAWARALRIRAHAAGSPAGEGLADIAPSGPVPGVDPGAPPLPGGGHTDAPPIGAYRAFHTEGAELRFVEGEFGRAGPATVWVRLAVPVVEGEEPSPLQRVAAAADFGNGVSSVLDFTRYLFINPDLTVYLARPAVGDWVALQASTRIGIPGVGLAECALWDTSGPIGRSLQGLVVERRP
jgi:Thioesterase-like superfamily